MIRPRSSARQGQKPRRLRHPRRAPQVTAPGDDSAGAREQADAEDGCSVSPRRLTDFANGVSYDFKSVVTFLTSPQCIASSNSISVQAANGVNFNSTAPYRLDNFAKSLSRSDLESSKRLDTALSTTIPALLRENPLGSKEILPILGQLTLLSPGAAKSTLANLIEQELAAGDENLSGTNRASRDAAAADLAKTLVRLGASEEAIATELAASIEDKAVLVQADGLGKIFRAMAAAATVDASLVPTFNLSAGALNRGVQKGKLLYQSDERNAMLAAVFQAIKSTVAGSSALEPGATELNEAIGALFNGSALASTELKRLWRESIRILSQSTTQTALAAAVALSLTPEMIFLAKNQRELLLSSASNYPEIAASIQSCFLLAWNKSWNDLHDGTIKPGAFNKMKDTYFEPLVARILELDPYLIDPYWLREVQRRGMVRDQDIEKKFPRFVLAFLDRREKATKMASAETGLEPTLSSMAENFAVLWTLSNVHVPALMKWVKKNEQ